MYNEFADYDKYYQMITEAEQGLMTYRKLHPDGIDFFIKSHWNKVTLSIAAIINFRSYYYIK
jgi:hypothetical protein